jgi:hypothetical protein
LILAVLVKINGKIAAMGESGEEFLKVETFTPIDCLVNY